MKRILLAILLLLSVWTNGISQKKDSTLFFKSALSVTHNGFSFIPSFSLGKPAAVLDLAIGNKRLSFEPQFRFALEGRPWSFIFIYRYKIVNKDKFQFKLGGHLPAFNWSKETVIFNGAAQEAIVTKRFLAGELWPIYKFNDKVSMGIYYLRGHGFDQGTTRDANFVGLQTYFTNIKISEVFFLSFTPQFFYLKTDTPDGFYFTYSLNLAAKHFPLSISHIINKAISTEIPNTDFNWNVSLVYSFNKAYVLK